MHMAKYTSSAAGHMLKHYAREKDENGRYVTDGRKNIDPSRTHLNYAVGDSFVPIDRIKWLLSRDDVKCLKRADVNVLCDLVLTAPQDLPKEDYEEFFQVGYDFLCKRYGIENQFGVYENILSSWVHMDEAQPHMHFAFVPLKKTKKIDKKTQKETTIYKVSAKQVVNRTDLKTLHPDMSAAMKKAFGRDVGIENGITKANGNQTVEQLKYKSELEKEINSLSEQIEGQNKTIFDKKQEITQLNKKVADMRMSDELVNSVVELQNTLVNAEQDLEYLYEPSNNRSKKVNEVISNWNCGIEPIKEYDGNYERDSKFIKIIDWLKDLIKYIKDLLSDVLGKDYEQTKTEIENEINKEKDEPDITE